MEQIGSMRGTVFHAVQAALPKLEEKGLKLDDYVVSVFERESSFIVVGVR